MMDRRKFLMCTSAMVAAAAMPSVGYETETFQMAEAAGMIPAPLSTLIDPEIYQVLFGEIRSACWDARRIIRNPDGSLLDLPIQGVE